MADKGKYKPKNRKKYKGDPTKIWYRSSWEKRFMKWCDSNPNVLQWQSEEVVIPYKSPVDGKIHRYFVDFTVWLKHKDNSVSKHLIEVKPESQTLPPKKPKRKTKRYIKECITYSINQAKWNAAIEYCSKKSMRFNIVCFEDGKSGTGFRVITENFLQTLQ